MTIYSQIAYNKARTFLLIGLFIIVFTFLFYLIGKFTGGGNTYLIIGFLISLFSSLGSYFYSDRIVLFSTGAKPANRKEHFNFYTVAENVSIAAGLPLPKLYVINSDALNAFATGRNPKYAVVCATTGLLKILKRAELEGVVAHELGHVKNYDILLSSIVAVLVGTLVLVTDWLMRSLFWGGLRGDDDDRPMSPLLIVVFILTLIVAPIAATLIQLAISRKRELLADATGALITRNPDALAEALQKIAGDNTPLRTASNANAHLFIYNPFKRKGAKMRLAGLFSTHPPVEERIRLLHEM